MSTSIKDIAATQLQDIIATALSQLTGQSCSVSVSELRFETSTFESMTGAESMSFAAKATLKSVESGKPVPF
jgi:hypothetical protein